MFSPIYVHSTHLLNSIYVVISSKKIFMSAEKFPTSFFVRSLQKSEVAKPKIPLFESINYVLYS